MKTNALVRRLVRSDFSWTTGSELSSFCLKGSHEDEGERLGGVLKTRLAVGDSDPLLTLNSIRTQSIRKTAASIGGSFALRIPLSTSI